MIDYYELLQVAPTVSTEEIRKAFRRLAKQYHPDLQQHKSEADRREAQRRFVQLTQAYETLSHSAKRQAYDLQWRRELLSRQNAPKHTKKPPQTQVLRGRGSDPMSAQGRISQILLKRRWKIC